MGPRGGCQIDTTNSMEQSPSWERSKLKAKCKLKYLKQFYNAFSYIADAPIKLQWPGFQIFIHKISIYVEKIRLESGVVPPGPVVEVALLINTYSSSEPITASSSPHLSSTVYSQHQRSVKRYAIHRLITQSKSQPWAVAVSRLSMPHSLSNWIIERSGSCDRSYLLGRPAECDVSVGGPVSCLPRTVTDENQHPDPLIG